MRWPSFLKRKSATSGVRQPNAWLRDLVLGDESAAGEAVSPDSLMRISTAVACVRVLSEGVAHLPLKVYRRAPDGSKEPLTDHPLWSLFHSQPNPWQSPFEYLETSMGHTLTRGNHFAYKNRAGGRVAELIPLDPDRMRVEVAEDRTVTYKLGNETIPADDVFHLKFYSHDGFTGVSPIQWLRESAGMARAAEKFGGGLFRNGLNASAVITHPETLGEEAQKNLRESIEKAHAGADNAHRFMILEEDMRVEKLSITPEDAQFLETRRYQAEQIAAIYRVPLHLIGDMTNGTYSNIEESNRHFQTQVIAPWLRRIEGAIHRSLLTDDDKRDGVFVEFKQDGALRGNTTERFAAYQVALGQRAFLTVNEVRKAENMDPIEGGDELPRAEPEPMEIAST